MADITYETPPGGGYLATVPGSSAFDLGSGGWWGGDMGWIAEAARRSALNKLQKQNLELKMMDEAYRHRPGNIPSYAERMAEQARAEQATSEILKQRALRMAPPKKWIGGPGMVPGVIEAPEDYTGLQRQIFLPQGAGFEGPSLYEMSEGGRNRSISDLQRMGIEDAEMNAARRQLSGLNFPNPSVSSYEWTQRNLSEPWGSDEETTRSNLERLRTQGYF